MPKDNYLKFRCTDKMKSIVESKAKENNMSVTAYLEYLIRRDVDILRIVMSDNLTEDIENRLKEEESCYSSSNKEWWLFTDMNVFNQISKEYKFNEKTENRDKIYDYSVEEYLYTICEDKIENFMGAELKVTEFVESATNIIEDDEDIYRDGWDEEFIKNVKDAIIVSIASDLEDELLRLKQKGYNLSFLKDVFERLFA